jgi:hypothetical protein
MTPLTPLQQHPCAGPQGVGIATLIFRYFLRYFSSTHRTDLSRFRGTFHSFDPVGLCYFRYSCRRRQLLSYLLIGPCADGAAKEQPPIFPMGPLEQRKAQARKAARASGRDTVLPAEASAIQSDARSHSAIWVPVVAAAQLAGTAPV